MQSTKGPLESSISEKLSAMFKPHHLEIQNDSAKHSHHKAMKDDPDAAATGETHFNVVVVSDSFEGVALIERHRMVNDCLKEELEEKGLHALSIKAKTIK